MNKFTVTLLLLFSFSDIYAKSSFSSSSRSSSSRSSSSSSSSRSSSSSSYSRPAPSAPKPEASRPSAQPAPAKEKTSFWSTSKKAAPAAAVGGAVVGAAAVSASSAPAAPDKAAQSALQATESKKKYDAYKASKAPPVEPPKWSGTYKVESPNYWKERDRRENAVYKNYYTQQPPSRVVYQDNFSPFFYLWLMNQSLDTRAAWAYNHRNDIADDRYKDLVAKDAALEAKVAALEAQGSARDPNFTPSGMDTDLMYDKDKIREIRKIEKPKEKDSGPGAGTFVLVTLLVVGAGAGGYYLYKKRAA